jgi:hypothetical protein
MLDNINNFNDSTKTLQFNADKSCLLILDNTPTSVEKFTIGISSARYHIQPKIAKQAQSKEQYQIDLVSDIIDRRHIHLSPSTSLSDKLEREELIKRKLKYMSEANARRNLFTMLRFDIKRFIDPDSINRNALTRVDVTISGHITPLTTNN